MALSALKVSASPSWHCSPSGFHLSYLSHPLRLPVNEVYSLSTLWLGFALLSLVTKSLAVSTGALHHPTNKLCQSPAVEQSRMKLDINVDVEPFHFWFALFVKPFLFLRKKKKIKVPSSLLQALVGECLLGDWQVVGLTFGQIWLSNLPNLAKRFSKSPVHHSDPPWTPANKETLNKDQGKCWVIMLVNFEWLTWKYDHELKWCLTPFGILTW